MNELYALTNKERKYIFEYLQDAPFYETVPVNNKDFLLTHSGLGSFDTNKRISEYSKFDLIWNRPSLNARYFDDIVTVLDIHQVNIMDPNTKIKQFSQIHGLTLTPVRRAAKVRCYLDLMI